MRVVLLSFFKMEKKSLEALVPEPSLGWTWRAEHTPCELGTPGEVLGPPCLTLWVALPTSEPLENSGQLCSQETVMWFSAATGLEAASLEPGEHGVAGWAALFLPPAEIFRRSSVHPAVCETLSSGTVEWRLDLSSFSLPGVY